MRAEESVDYSFVFLRFGRARSVYNTAAKFHQARGVSYDLFLKLRIAVVISSLVRFHLMSGLRRIAPRPEHGASIRTQSAGIPDRTRASASISCTLRRPRLLTSSLALALPRRQVGSYDSAFALQDLRQVRGSMPEPQHRSSTVSPLCGATI